MSYFDPALRILNCYPEKGGVTRDVVVMFKDTDWYPLKDLCERTNKNIDELLADAIKLYESTLNEDDVVIAGRWKWIKK